MSANPNVLSLNQWDGVVPVILPVGPQTIASIGSASAGVAVPFFFFLVAMYYILVPIWMSNFHSDKNCNCSSWSQQNVADMESLSTNPTFARSQCQENNVNMLYSGPTHQISFSLSPVQTSPTSQYY